MEEVFQATYAFEQFVLEYAQYHLNKTTPNLSIKSQEIGKGKKKKDLLPVVSQCRLSRRDRFVGKEPLNFCVQKKKSKLKKMK